AVGDVGGRTAGSSPGERCGRPHRARNRGRPGRSGGAGSCRRAGHWGSWRWRSHSEEGFHGIPLQGELAPFAIEAAPLDETDAAGQSNVPSFPGEVADGDEHLQMALVEGSEGGAEAFRHAELA